MIRLGWNDARVRDLGTEGRTWPSRPATWLLPPCPRTPPRWCSTGPTAPRDSGLDPGRIFLEITENAAVDDVEETAARLRNLRLLGVRLALDDFGVGHSPLAMLRRMPFDVLKIDRSFVAHVHDQARD